jgi:hypothetical protein
VTFPAFKHLVQTRTRFTAPATFARIETRFASHRRFVTL